MERWTERQLLVALTWIGLQWNKPDRHDYYTMRLEQSMLQMLSTKKVTVKPIKFKYRKKKRKSGEEAVRYDPQEVMTDIAKAVAISRSTLPVTVRRVSKDGTRVLSEKQIDPVTGMTIPGTERKLSD